MTSEAAKRATSKYQSEKMELVSIRVKRDEHLSDRIKLGAQKRGIKPAQYIKQAIITALESDNIP